MSRKFEDDARRAIESVERTGITKRQGVLVLIFGRRTRAVVGYLNENPYNAARAMVEFLIEKYPDAKRPVWVRDLTTKRSRRKTRPGRVRSRIPTPGASPRDE
jgi:hypothetical protein